MIRRSIAIGCIFFGAALMYIGYGKTQSVMGSLSKSLSGGYSTETIAYIAIGGILVTAGLVMVFGKKKKKR
jgi:LPXTG-motif cell wall-anchored protein